MRRTVLYDEHKALGARFVEFGGWEMPVQYSGVNDEHVTTRSAAGLFDASHLGQFSVQGDNATAFLNLVCSNDLNKVAVGRAQYNLLLNEHGGVVDDILVYRLGERDYFLCVNADNTEKDFRWLRSWQERSELRDVELDDVSARFAVIAIQGPRAVEIVAHMYRKSGDLFGFSAFPRFSLQLLELQGATVITARTGYTGEDGFELYCPVEVAKQVWKAALECGVLLGLKPVGLGARDTLRLEACLPLYGHELRDEICALSSNVHWAIKLEKQGSHPIGFVGREALSKLNAKGVEPVLIGIEVIDPGVVRAETKLFSAPPNPRHSAGEQEIGWVTSGTKTPTVGRSIGLAYVPRSQSKIGTELYAEVRDKRLRVRVVSIPFYRSKSR